MTEPAHAAQITEVAATLHRQWKLLIAAMAIGSALAVAVGLALPARYSAETVVAVNPVNTDPANASADAGRSIAMATERELAQSGHVAAIAAERLRARFDVSAKDVQKATSVESPQGSQVLNIGFSAPTARQAAAGASTVAVAYLEARRDVATAQIERLKDRTRAQIKALSVIDAKAGGSGSDLDEQARLAQVDTLGANLAALAVADPNPGRIVGPATQPPTRSLAAVVPVGLAGLLLGLFGGVPVALTRKDNHIRTVADLDAGTEDQLVLDGTCLASRSETWDLAARLLNLRSPAPNGETIVVDGENSAGRLPSGQELADACQRRGHPARFVAAESVDTRLFRNGWPADRQPRGWAGKVVIIDITKLDSDADRVTVASRADSVVIARDTDDDAVALNRRVALFRMGGAKLALSVLFPARRAFVEVVQ